MELMSILPIFSLAVLGLLNAGVAGLGVYIMQSTHIPGPELAITTIISSVLIIVLLSTAFSLLRLNAHKESILQRPLLHVLLGLMVTAAEATFVFLCHRGLDTCDVLQESNICGLHQALIAILGVTMAMGICHALLHGVVIIRLFLQRRRHERGMYNVRPFTQLHDSSSQASHQQDIEKSSSRRMEQQPEITSTWSNRNNFPRAPIQSSQSSHMKQSSSSQPVIFTNPFVPHNTKQNYSLPSGALAVGHSPKTVFPQSVKRVPSPALVVQKHIERHTDYDDLPRYSRLGYGVGQQYPMDLKRQKSGKSAF